MQDQIGLLVAQDKLQITFNQNQIFLTYILFAAIFVVLGICLLLAIENVRRKEEIQKLRDWAGLPDTGRR